MSAADDGPGILTRSELAQLAREPSAEPCDPSYWLGSAGGEVSRWRERAIAAERELAALRRLLEPWRHHT